MQGRLSRRSSSSAAAPAHPRTSARASPFTNFNTTYDFLANLTKVWGRHTSKVGFYAQQSLKDQSGVPQPQRHHQVQRQPEQPLRHRPRRANAATGVFDCYEQANICPIGEYRYWNVEWYVQDNWKVSDRLTLDYGLRFYWVQPQYDQAVLTSNFMPALFDQSQAVRLYRPGLNAGGTRVAVDPVTGQTLTAVVHRAHRAEQRRHDQRHRPGG